MRSSRKGTPASDEETLDMLDHLGSEAGDGSDGEEGGYDRDFVPEVDADRTC